VKPTSAQVSSVGVRAFVLKRRVIEIADIVVDGRNVRLKMSAELQPGDVRIIMTCSIKILSGCTAPGRRCDLQIAYRSMWYAS
jgi:hypothetical protein